MGSWRDGHGETAPVGKPLILVTETRDLRKLETFVCVVGNVIWAVPGILCVIIRLGVTAAETVVFPFDRGGAADFSRQAICRCQCGKSFDRGGAAEFSRQAICRCQYGKS